MVNEAQPSTNGWSGKVVSILGDSISTFQNYNPVADGHNLTHRVRYSPSNASWYFNTGGTVDDTYWMGLINKLGAKLGINDSWAGSRVHNSLDSDSGDQGPNSCMASITRITNLGSNGTPDLILYYGGTNDCGGGITVGTFDSTATYTTDLTTTKWATFADAYKDSIMRLQHYYPNAKILVMLPMYCTTYYTYGNLDKYNEVIKEICDYFGVEYIDFRRCGVNSQNLGTTLGDGIHPTVEGFHLMGRYLFNKLMSMYSEDGVENVVYTVTNSLTTNVNEDRYIKGVSAGHSYSATITGSSLSSISVTMGETDITSSVYNPSTGVINISSVTDNIVIEEGEPGGDIWYTNEGMTGTQGVNVLGYGWASKASEACVNKPVNLVQIKSNLSSGTFEIGKSVFQSSTYSDVQSVSWDSSNKDANNIVTIELPTTMTLNTNEYFVVYPETQPTTNAFLFGGSTSAGGFYTDVPITRRSGTPWSPSGQSLGVNFGYRAS